MDEDRRRYVVKFYRPERWSAAQIGEEHQFALDLAGEIPAVAPLALQGATLHTHGGFFFALFPSVGGRQYEIDNLDQLEWVGRFLGRIHQVGGERLFAERPTMGIEEYLTARVRRWPVASCCRQRSVRVLQATDNLIAAIAALASELAAARLHGDCHPGNILWRDGPLFVDLDDARNGPAVQDLWMLLHGERRDQLMQLDVLLEAYGELPSSISASWR